jgi:hypothetical protein
MSLCISFIDLPTRRNIEQTPQQVSAGVGDKLKSSRLAEEQQVSSGVAGKLRRSVAGSLKRSNLAQG